MNDRRGQPQGALPCPVGADSSPSDAQLPREDRACRFGADEPGKAEGRQVAAETSRQVGDFLGEAQSQARDQASAQQQQANVLMECGYR